MPQIHFGTDGWRGVIAEEFTFANVRLVARAVAGHFLRAGPHPVRLIVGHDTRFLSREFAEAAARTLAAAGVEPTLTSGFAPTPAISYTVRAQGAAGGVVITASHNPPCYNGFKVKTAAGGSAPEEVTAAVEAEIRALQASGLPPEPGPTAPVPLVDPAPAYFDALKRFLTVEAFRGTRLQVVVDPMYGAGQGCLVALLGQLGIQAEEIHGEPNPGFGGLQPEPIPPHLDALMARVRQRAGASRVGLALDGDADRAGAVDEAGRFVNAHQIFALLLHHLVHDRGSRGTVVKTFSTTDMIDKLARAAGIECRVTPIGFKHIAPLMLDGSVLMGGEESGGIGYRGHIPERDGLLTCLLLLELMAVRGRGLGELVRDLQHEVGPHHYHRLDLEVPSIPHGRQRLEQLRAHPPAAPPGMPLTALEELDGLKLRFADGSWLLLRPSGTEPIFRVYAEAPDEDRLTTLLAFGRALANPA